MQTPPPYEDDYGTCVYTHVWLRIMDETLDPAEVTLVLGIEPSKVQLRGETAPGRSRPAKFSGWFLESKGNVESKDARRHLDWLIARIEGKGAEFRQLIGRGYLVDVCCRWDSVGHGGPTLSSVQMAALGQLGIDLWFDVYFAEEESET